MAKLYFRYGTMNSGKSMYLLAQANNFEENGTPFLMMKSVVDTRDKNEVRSRALQSGKPCISITERDDIFGLISAQTEVMGYKWILVDEAQFLKKNQIDQLARIVDELDINVACYGLRTNFLSKSFDGSKRLFEIADDLEEIKISCKCGRKAIMNARINPKTGGIVTKGNEVAVGGNDMYVPVCRKCYNEMKKTAKKSDNPIWKKKRSSKNPKKVVEDK